MLIYAHRGASADFPEHTMAGYRGAIDQGADGFECDIRLTKDRQIICWHDSTTTRMAGGNSQIANSTLSELVFADPLKFSDLLNLAIDHKKNLAVETKHPVATGGAIERELLQLLNERQTEIVASGINIAIMSFSRFGVQRIAASKYPGVFLIQHAIARSINPAPILGPGLHIIKRDPELVQRTHSSGKKVFVWTVNSDEDVRLCARLGVDVIMSDKPAQAREALG